MDLKNNASDWDFYSLLSIVATILILLVCGIIIYRLIDLMLTLCTEKIQVKAKIIKTSESISSHTTNQTITPSAYLVNGSIPQSIHSNSITTQNHQYTVTFQLANGKRLAFNVSKRQFDKLLEGDIGILTYKRRWVIDFTPIVKHF